jgi:hypothetical protein
MTAKWACMCVCFAERFFERALSVFCRMKNEFKVCVLLCFAPRTPSSSSLPKRKYHSTTRHAHTQKTRVPFFLKQKKLNEVQEAPRA